VTWLRVQARVALMQKWSSSLWAISEGDNGLSTYGDCEVHVSEMVPGTPRLYFRLYSVWVIVPEALDNGSCILTECFVIIYFILCKCIWLLLAIFIACPSHITYHLMVTVRFCRYMIHKNVISMEPYVHVPSMSAWHAQGKFYLVACHSSDDR
jgi:hypothetical protein